MSQPDLLSWSLEYRSVAERHAMACQFDLARVYAKRAAWFRRMARAK